MWHHMWILRQPFVLGLVYSSAKYCAPVWLNNTPKTALIWSSHGAENGSQSYQTTLRVCWLITRKQPGFDMSQKIWHVLDRILTNYVRCADFMFKWGKTPSPECDCNSGRRTIRHIIKKCSLRSYTGPFDNFLSATEITVENNYKTIIVLTWTFERDTWTILHKKWCC